MKFECLSNSFKVDSMKFESMSNSFTHRARFGGF